MQRQGTLISVRWVCTGRPVSRSTSLTNSPSIASLTFFRETSTCSLPPLAISALSPVVNTSRRMQTA